MVSKNMGKYALLRFLTSCLIEEEIIILPKVVLNLSRGST